MNEYFASWLEQTQDLHLPPFSKGDTPQSSKSWDREFVERQTSAKKEKLEWPLEC